MANNVYVSDTAAEAAANAVTALCNSGTITIWSGAQPTNANTAVGAQVKLVTLTFGATAFGAAGAGGIATANAITAGTAVATNTAAWFRVFQSNGTTVVFDGSVGTAGCDMNLNTTAITSGANVSCTSMTYTATEH